MQHIIHILQNSTIELIDVMVRVILAVLIGGLIGTERARHGRAAGMRTHILVCIGSALTAMTGIYINQIHGVGDVGRIAAQVVSGVGFLGAGMIILKNGSVITGLTTAAGVWATAAIGIAVGYGFYSGAIATAILFYITITLLSKIHKFRNTVEIIYIESDSISGINCLIDQLKELIPADFSVSISAPKTAKEGNVGIQLLLDKQIDINFESILKLENVLYVTEE